MNVLQCILYSFPIGVKYLVVPSKEMRKGFLKYELKYIFISYQQPWLGQLWKLMDWLGLMAHSSAEIRQFLPDDHPYSLNTT